jgi:hypothetical protein
MRLFPPPWPKGQQPANSTDCHIMASGLAQFAMRIWRSCRGIRGDGTCLTCVCLKGPSQLAASFLLALFTDDAPPLPAALVRRGTTPRLQQVCFIVREHNGQTGPHSLCWRRCRAAALARCFVARLSWRVLLVKPRTPPARSPRRTPHVDVPMDRCGNAGRPNRYVATPSKRDLATILLPNCLTQDGTGWDRSTRQ